ncbi:MAG: hypothetical protein ACK574_12470, partial [Bacteroidota bacterium]
MKEKAISYIRCPKTKQRFERIEIEVSNNDEIIKGKIYNKEGDAYNIENGIPDLTTEDDLVGDAKFAREYYKKIAHTYDENVDITFELYYEDEYKNRNYMVDLLELKPNYRVLEVSAGTGKDSELILKHLSENG